VTIDVAVETEIAAAPADIAAVMFDPQREPDRLKAVTGVELVDPALKPGARVTHRATFMGRNVAWTTEVEAVHFPHVLAMKIPVGPYIGVLRYDIQRNGAGSKVRIRTAGEAAQLGALPNGLVTEPLKALLNDYLGRLKGLVERR